MAKPANSSEAPVLVSRLRAAAMLDVDPQTVDALILRGQLRKVKIGRKVLVRYSELMKLVEACEQ